MTTKRLFFFQFIASFFAGASLVCLIILFFRVLPNFRIWDNATSYGPWLEEGLKFAVVLILIKLVDLKNSTIPFVGIGFGIIELTSYFRFRGLFGLSPVLAHTLFAFTMAYFIYLARNPKYSSLRSIWYSLALLIPVYLHLLYNMAITKWFM